MIHIISNPVIEKIRSAGMRKKLKQSKFIIMAIFLMTGVSIAGWTFAFHYDNKVKSAAAQNEFNNDILAENEMPSTLDHNRIILLLVFTGLVGFFGVRRQNNTIKTFLADNRSKIKLRINLLSQDNPEGQTCQLRQPGCVAS